MEEEAAGEGVGEGLARVAEVAERGWVPEGPQELLVSRGRTWELRWERRVVELQEQQVWEAWRELAVAPGPELELQAARQLVLLPV